MFCYMCYIIIWFDGFNKHNSGGKVKGKIFYKNKILNKTKKKKRTKMHERKISLLAI
jgi:hypothetical protein